MKKTFTILTAALMLLAMFAIPMGMWGQTTHTIGWGTASGDAGTYTNFTATSGSVANILSFSTEKNSANSAPAYNASSKELRLYNASNGDGCSITISPSSGLTITQIVITATSGYTSDIKYSVNGGTATAATWSNNTCTISGIEASTSLMVQNVKTSTQQLRIKTIAVMYAVDGPVTYTVTYDCNGGTNGCPEDLTGLSPNTSITLANAPTKEHFNFEGWSDGTNTYDAGDSYTVNSHVTFTAQWESDGTAGEGSICFSSQSSCTAIDSQSVTGEDDLGNTWTITTEGTSSFTANSGYYQVGSGNSPASSITFTTTFDDEVNVTDFSATFGGFSATRASVVIKVDNTQVGSGSLNGTADVTVSSSSAHIGTTLTVIVTPTAGGVKCYNISYAYETIDNPAVTTTTTINVPANFNTDIYQGTTAGTLTATVKDNENNVISGATVTWSSSNTGVATIDANGEVTLVAVGTTTITASYAGVEDEYRPSMDTYELTVTDSNAPGTVNNPYTVAQARAAIDANTGITNVYATGIISQIDSYQSNTITYWISDDGTTTNQLEVYKGKNLNNTNFTALSDIEVGATVIVYGTLTKYNNTTYEFTSGNYLTSYTAPVHAVEAPTFSPVAGTYATAQSVTISCTTDGTTIHYTTDGSVPTHESTEYTSEISVSTTTTIKAIAWDGTNSSNVAIATYHINSQSNPYTVTQALAFLEYPANGIYVQGIVSTAPTQAPTSNGELTYYISVDGEANNQLEVYKGKGLEQAAFSAQDDIQVGDIVTIYGNVVIYNNTKEFASGNYLVSFERPAVPVISASDVNIAYDATSGSIAYEITNEVIGASISPEVETGATISNFALGADSGGSIAFNCAANTENTAKTATVTLNYVSGEEILATKQVVITQAAYSTEYNGQGTFTKITSTDDLEDGGYYVLTYDNHALKAAYYGNSSNEMASESVTITNDQINNPATNIVWKLEANSTNWNLYNESAGKYCNITSNSTTGFNLGDNATSYTVSASDPAATYTFATTATGGRCISYYSNNTSFRSYASSNATTKLTLYKLGEAPTDPYFTAENVEIAHNANGGSITYTLNNPVDGGVVSVSKTSGDWLTLGQGTTSPISFTCSANTAYTARTATVTLTYTYNTNETTTATVTVTQGAAPYPTTTYTLATSIVSGRHYIITNGTDKAMGAQGSNNRSAVAVTIDNGVASVNSADVIEFVINGPDANNYYTIYDANYNTTGGYLYAASSGSNHLKSQQFNDANGLWSIVISNNKAEIKAHGANTHNWILFNTSGLFSCYTDISNAVTDEVYLYVKDETTPTYDFYKDIAKYTIGTTVGSDLANGWYLIASPTAYTLYGTNMVNDEDEADYDLYRFNSAAVGAEWENYKNSEHQDFTRLEVGKGYLYANKDNITLHFAGAPATSGDVSVAAGWNLIGNPLGTAATITNSYYRMNDDHNEVVVSAGAIAVMEGVFVKTTTASEQITFTPSNGKEDKSVNNALVINLNRDDKVIDRAIVRFGESEKLSKFQLFEGSTKIYIPQNDTDYAIAAMDDNTQAFSLNFHAKTTGKYTLSLGETDNLSYIHLFDRMTGEDIDMLLEDSYSFIGSPADSEERFIVRLSYNAGISTEDTFAFQNGSDVIVNGNGELQVFDLTGRMVMNTTINGHQAVSMPQGVYVFRMIGDDVKTQKIVVR